MPIIKDRKVIGYEYKNAYYVTSSYNDTDDAIIIKETIHYDDNTQEPNLRIVKNYERNFYIVLERYQKFEDKRMSFEIDKCKEYKSTQRAMNDMIRRITRASQGSSKILNRNQFLFGTDIALTTLVKGKYRENWGHLKSHYKTAHLDIERDVNGPKDQQEINMISVVSGNKIKQVILRSFLGHEEDQIQSKIQQLFDEKIQPILDEIYWEDKAKGIRNKKYKTMPIREYKIDVEVVDHEWETVTRIFEWIHQEKPDILSVWNLSYDLKEMVTALNRANIDPKDVFCDPNVPYEFREFRFQEGRPQIPDANGKMENIPPNERWHRVYAPSGFFWADQMVVRRRIRKHLPKEPSSALGAVLNSLFGFGKLYGDSCPDNIRDGTIDWHRWFQRFQKIFYGIYNIFDNVGSQLVDDYTTDLKITFPQQCGKSDLESYGSQGRKLADDLYYFLLKEGHILAGVSDKMVSELDKYSVPLDGWICTLASHLVDYCMGHKVIEELPDVVAKVVRWVLDIDVKSSYPSTGVWSNISRETTRRVMCRILGVSFEEQRRAGLNLSSGRVNSIDIIQKLCGAPRQISMLDRFVKKEGAILREIDEE